LALELDAVDASDAVGPDRERSIRGDRRVELPDGARGGVARVRSGSLAFGDLLLREGAESRERHEDLSAHLEHSGRPFAGVRSHRERNRPHGPQVRSHVLATLPVAPCRGAGIETVLVEKRDREAVDLRLDQVGDGLVGSEPPADVFCELRERLVARHLVERSHWRQVLDLPKTLRRRRPDTLSGRVGRDELGMLLLQRPQLVVEPVELGIRHDRLVLHVVRG
jgi:hypothetical protein